MNTFEMNRREALTVQGTGALSLGVPGVVLRAGKLDDRRNPGWNSHRAAWPSKRRPTRLGKKTSK